MKRSRALWLVAFGALCFGTLALFTPLAYRAGVSPLPLLMWRFIIAALIIGALGYRRNPDIFKVSKRDLARYAALGLLGYGASSLCYFLALKHAGSAVVSSLLYSYPALVAIGSVFLFNKKLTGKRVIALATVFLGCLCVVGLFGGSVKADALGIALAFGSGICYALFNLMSQKWLPGRSSMTMMTFAFGFNALGFAILTLFVNGPAALVSCFHWSATAWLWVTLIILIPTVIAVLVYLRGVRRLGAADAAVASSLEPLFTALLAPLVLGQYISAIQWIGVFLIAGGVAAASILEKTVQPLPSVPLSEDEIAQRRDDWVGPDGERTPEYARDKKHSQTKIKKEDLSEPDRRLRSLIIGGLTAVAVIVVLQLVLVVGIVWLTSLPAPDISLKNIADRSSQTTEVFAADGSRIAIWRGNESRQPVSYDRIPQNMRDATVAIEDKRFYEHGGVDLISVVRALKRNTEEGVIKQGGSTITQQLIKMLYTNGERTFARKIKEAILATRVEMSCDKSEVLEGYLNMAYYGQGAYGIESAARIYFDKDVTQLTISESAMLAGLVRSPGAYNAFKKPQPVIERRNLVLEAMHEQKMITSQEYEEARAQGLHLKPGNVARDSVTYPYFCDYVRQQLITELGEEKILHGGLKVYTTLDPALQKEAEKTAATFSREDDPEVSLVTVRQSDGAVLALVGGRDYKKSQFNLAVQGKRQPGSAFKPFTLLASLENGMKLDSTFDSSPFTTKVHDGVWKVNNYSDGAGYGMMTVRDATIHSVNTVYARMIMKTGPRKVAQFAKRFGFSDPLEPEPSLALGGLKYGVSPLEMAQAYATMANKGLKVTATPIASVYDRNNKPVGTWSTAQKRIYDASIGEQANEALADVVEEGTGMAARVPGRVCGKTGTTQSYRDAWFVGWNHGVSTAVWMGHPHAQVDMTSVHGRSVTGGSFPAQMWGSYMTQVQAIRPENGCAIPKEAQVEPEPLYDFSSSVEPSEDKTYTNN